MQRIDAIYNELLSTLIKLYKNRYHKMHVKVTFTFQPLQEDKLNNGY
jgi:hypothetical protein